jgi:hypothetical protein
VTSETRPDRSIIMSRRIAAGLALILPLANLEAAQPSSPVPKAPPALVKAQMDAARKAFELYLKRQQDRAGEPGPEKLYVWSRRWMEAQQALASEKDRRVQAAQDHLGGGENLHRLGEYGSGPRSR